MKQRSSGLNKTTRTKHKGAIIVKRNLLIKVVSIALSTIMLFVANITVFAGEFSSDFNIQSEATREYLSLVRGYMTPELARQFELLLVFDEMLQSRSGMDVQIHRGIQAQINMLAPPLSEDGRFIIGISDLSDELLMESIINFTGIDRSMIDFIHFNMMYIPTDPHIEIEYAPSHEDIERQLPGGVFTMGTNINILTSAGARHATMGHPTNQWGNRFITVSHGSVRVGDVVRVGTQNIGVVTRTVFTTFPRGVDIAEVAFTDGSTVGTRLPNGQTLDFPIQAPPRSTSAGLPVNLLTRGGSFISGSLIHASAVVRSNLGEWHDMIAVNMWAAQGDSGGALIWNISTFSFAGGTFTFFDPSLGIAVFSRSDNY